MQKLLLATVIGVFTVCTSGSAVATDRVEATLRPVSAASPQAVPAAETIGVTIRAGANEIWSGSLRIGPQHGSANFSMSKNEFVTPCPDGPRSNSRSTTSSLRLNFSLSRRNWQQERDKFNVNVNWTRPLPACRGEGTDTLGFNRVVEVAPGQTATIEGAGGLVVRLSRQR